jgi:hypothetical protein
VINTLLRRERERNHTHTTRIVRCPLSSVHAFRTRMVATQHSRHGDVRRSRACIARRPRAPRDRLRTCAAAHRRSIRGRGGSSQATECAQRPAPAARGVADGPRSAGLCAQIRAAVATNGKPAIGLWVRRHRARMHRRVPGRRAPPCAARWPGRPAARRPAVPEPASAWQALAVSLVVMFYTVDGFRRFMEAVSARCHRCGLRIGARGALPPRWLTSGRWSGGRGGLHSDRRAEDKRRVPLLCTLHGRVRGRAAIPHQVERCARRTRARARAHAA